jgi:hypothetical protein
VRRRRHETTSDDPRHLDGLAPRVISVESGEFYRPPSYAQLLVITHVLELPRDLRVPDGSTLLAGRPGEGVLAQLEHDVVEELLQTTLDPAEPAPSLRLAFRRPRVRVQVPLLAADEAFAKWDEKLIPRKGRRQRRRLVRRFRRKGITAPVTVVGATSIIDAQEWPSNQEAQEALLDSLLDKAVELLNDQIVALGLVSDEPYLAPISVGDLPPLCPVIMEVAPMLEGRRVGRSFLRELHRDLPSFAQDAPREEHVMLVANELARRQYAGLEPFFLFYVLWLRTRSALNSYRLAESVTLIGTAVEVLVSTAIREASIALGESDERREDVLGAPFRAKLEHHLGRYANLGVDLDDEANPVGAWRNGGYKTRNRVVHSGHQPTLEEAEQAFDQASMLAVAIRDGLLGNPLTRDLGDVLGMGRRDEREDEA